MTGTARHYFARGNTARGDYSLYPSALQGVRKVYWLEGLPGTGKSTVLQRLADHAMSQGQDVELFHSRIRPDELDALIITNLSTAFLDADACGRPSIDDGETVPVDFNRAVDDSLISENARIEIAALQEELTGAYANAYDSFAAALRIHDEWESFYIESMDFRKANEVAKETADTLFGERSLDKKAAVRHLFFGAATPEGAVDHIQNLTGGIDTRIFIKGRAGSGKSTLLKQLAAAAEQRGFDVDVFHCGFDPNSLDMLIFPELSLAIFDSTAPHEYFPDRESDRILDMYSRVILPGIDERYSAELDIIKKRYAQKMQEATSYLHAAREIDSRIKAVYTAASDFSVVERLELDLQEAFAGQL